jgi:hypothetical protein
MTQVEVRAMQNQVAKAPATAVGRKKVVLGVLMVMIAGAAFCFGRSVAKSQTPAQTTTPGKIAPAPIVPPPPSDYSRRVVAHIYKNIPITREELGEYLIARFGAERLENLVNRRIIELACQSKGIVVSDAEVEAALKDDLAGMNLNQKDFTDKVLKHYGKTMYEWKEDVLRPKLAMTKFCRGQIVVSEEDLKGAFEAHYGGSVECRMILIPKDSPPKYDYDLYDRVRKSDQEFDSEARKQGAAPLAANGGLIPPIYHHYFEPIIEKEAFSLKPGEVSKLLTLGDGSRVILKCVKHIPPDTTKRPEDERAKLYHQVSEAKLAQMMPQLFKKLREEANPQVYLKKRATAEDDERLTRRLLAPATVTNAPSAPAPSGVVPAGGQKKD